MITFDNFSFRYEERDKFTLKDLNLTIQTGEFVLLTGRSGCGKTTLIRCLNGLIPHFYKDDRFGHRSESELLAGNAHCREERAGGDFQEQ